MAGKSNMVTIPRTYKSGPNSHKTTATYITDDEIGLLRALDIHNSGIGTENHYGPGGLLNMDGGDSLADVYGTGRVPGRNIPDSVRNLLAGVQLPTGTRTNAGGTPLGTATGQRSQPRAEDIIYSGPGYRTNRDTLEKSMNKRAEIAQYSPRAQEIKVKESRVGTVIPSGNGEDPNGNGEDPNGNGTKKTNGNGTKTVIKEVVNESGGSPFFDIFSPYRNEERYTGPTVLEVDAPARGLLDYSQWMPPEGVGLRTYGPQRAMFSNQGANWQPQWQGGGLGYQPPQGVTYAPDYQTVDTTPTSETTSTSGFTDPLGGQWSSYHDWYMNSPRNPAFFNHLAALDRLNAANANQELLLNAPSSSWQGGGRRGMDESLQNTYPTPAYYDIYDLEPERSGLLNYRNPNITIY